MREIGGYIELDRYTLPMLHEGAVALNCGRNALAYLIQARKIEHILIPKFLCSSVADVCRLAQIKVTYYSIAENFLPKDIKLPDDAWLYLVNYYGQISNEQIAMFARTYERVIVDNVQAYFQKPVEGIDTLYTCRKFFGVPDGAFLYTTARIDYELERDESFEHMRYLLGRFERTGYEFYPESVENNNRFEYAPIRRMSLLTENLLHAIDYESVKNRRTENFFCLHKQLESINPLKIRIPEGAFMYPLYLSNGAEIRRKLQQKRIYIPTLWPNVLELNDLLERRYAQNILPLPCDQRYDKMEMQWMVSEVKNLSEEIVC